MVINNTTELVPRNSAEEQIQTSESKEVKQQRELDEAFVELTNLEQSGVKTEDQIVELKVVLEGNSKEEIQALETKLIELGVPPLSEEAKNKILGNTVDGAVGLETRKAAKHAALLEVLSAAGKIEGKNILAESLNKDPRLQSIIEEKSLEYLKTKDARWFNREFNGEIAPSGYLLDKKGKETNFLPSQNITDGLQEVMDGAISEFASKFPEDYKTYNQVKNDNKSKVEQGVADRQRIGKENAAVLERISGKPFNMSVDGTFGFASESKVSPALAGEETLVASELNDNSRSREGLVNFGLELVEEGGEDKALESITELYTRSMAGNDHVITPDRTHLQNLNYVKGLNIERSLKEGQDMGLYIVPTEAVIGSVQGSFEDWSGNQDGGDIRNGLIETIAADLLEEAKANGKSHDSKIRKAFEPNKTLGVRLNMIMGPEGPVFYAQDGTHRISAAKLAEMPKILSQVKEFKERNTVSTQEKYRADEWKQMIQRGLIKGEVTEEEGGGYFLKIDKQILPWCSTKRDDFFDANIAYKKVYPNTFKKIRSLVDNKLIPEEVFLDKTGIALNLYLYKPEKLNDWIEELKKKGK